MAAALVGAQWLDPLVGPLIAAVIVGVLVSTMRNVFRRLMDGLDPKVLDRAEEIAVIIPGVCSVHSVKGRWSGHKLLLEDAIAEEVSHTLRERVAHSGQVTVKAVPAR